MYNLLHMQNKDIIKYEVNLREQKRCLFGGSYTKNGDNQTKTLTLIPINKIYNMQFHYAVVNLN